MYSDDFVINFLAVLIAWSIRALGLWIAWSVLSEPLGLPALSWLQCLWLILGYAAVTYRWTKKKEAGL